MGTVIIIVSSMITAVGILLCVCNLYNKKIKVIRKALFVLILTAFLFFIVENTTNLTKLTFNYLSTLFSMYLLLLDKNIKKSIIYTTIIFIESIFIEIVLSLILKTIVNFDELYNAYPIVLLMFNLLVNIFLVLITRLKFVRKAANKFNFSHTLLKVILVIIILLCFLIAVQNHNIVNTNSIFYISNAIMFFFIIIIVYIIVDINNRNNEISNKYNQMMEFMTEYENIIDEQGKRNHEYKNQLLILGGFIDDKKKLKSYLKTIIDDHKTGENYEIRQLSHFPNGGLKGLLYYKIAKMKENNIKYFLYISKEVSKPLEKLDIRKYKDISKILGVLIDNAIEASLESNKKELLIDFKKDDNYLIITISNTYKGDVEISRIGTGYSTKGRSRGYGLKLVKDIIKNDKDLELITDKNDKEFIQTLMIDIK